MPERSGEKRARGGRTRPLQVVLTRQEYDIASTLAQQNSSTMAGLMRDALLAYNNLKTLHEAGYVIAPNHPEGLNIGRILLKIG